MTSVIYYDHRGGGRSSRLHTFEGISHNTLTADADALRRHLGHEQIVLLGHSYGGMLALEYALRYQEHLLGLVLCSTALAWDYTDETTENALKRGTERQIAALEALRRAPIASDTRFQALWNEIQPLYFHHPNGKVIADMDANTRFSASAYDLSEVLLAEFSLDGKLEGLTIPTLIITGRHDWVTPPSQAKRMHEQLPHAEMFFFEESGHYPFIEEQNLFNQQMRDWLARI